jgi:hypothetical protein
MLMLNASHHWILRVLTSMSRSPFGLDGAKNSTKTYEFEATPPPEENWGVHGSIGVPEMIVSEETTTLRDTL